jgi:hypothetical protein
MAVYSKAPVGRNSATSIIIAASSRMVLASIELIAASWL